MNKPSHIGEYRIIEVISSSLDTNVYLASSGRDTSLFAIRECESEARARSEYSVLTRLSSESIVTPVESTDRYIVTKYYHQRSLDKLGGYSDEQLAWDIIKSIASALSSIHKEGYAHLNVSPSNMLMDDCSTIVLADFSESLVLGTTIEGRSFTPFDAPELYKSGAIASSTMDIWSLGASVFFLLMGVSVFGGRGGAGQNANTSIPSFRNDKYSNELNELVRSCLSFNPEKRPSTDYIIKLASQVLKNKTYKQTSRRLKQPVKEKTVSSLDYWKEEMCV